MRRRMRAGPLLLVFLAHVVVVGLLLMMERRFSPERSTVGELVYVLPITPMLPPAAVPEPAPKPQRVRNPPAPPTVQSPPAIQIEPEPITVPAPAPRINWQREMERSVRKLAEADEPARYRSLDSDPTPLELPQGEDSPPPFYMLPNGDKVAKFRIGDRIVTCVSPQIALDEHFAIWAQFRPSRCSSTKPGSAFLKPPPARSAMAPEE